MAKHQRRLSVSENVNFDQRRASNPQASSWVAASAGTGKTKVLTDRVLRLLLAGSAPNDILCLTYTRAAAAEMSNRIATKLAGWATMPIESAHGPSLTKEFMSLGISQPREADFSRARVLFANMLDCAGGMQIQTIHSFCQSLLSRFPLEVGLLPGFKVLDDRAAGELARQALEELFAAEPHANLRFTQALERLLQWTGDRKLKQLLVGEIINKRQMFLSADTEDYVRAVAAMLDVDATIDQSHLNNRLIAGLPRERLADLARILTDGSSVNDRKFAEGLSSFLEMNFDEQETLWGNLYAPLFLTAKGEIKKQIPTKKVCGIHPHAMDVFLDEAHRIQIAQEQSRKMRLLEINEDLFIVARAWLEKLEFMKRRQVLLDFDDLVRHTRRLLNDESRAQWILYKLDHQIKHLLVDEAQDTSKEQWDIVRRLTEEFYSGQGTGKDYTLFVVGDEKQSIYSFNGADPAAFNKARHEYAGYAESSNSRWEDVPLSVSFRSVDTVLNLVNEVFSDPSVRQGVSHEEFRQLPARAGDGGLVELWSPLLKQEQEKSEAWALPLVRVAQTTPSIQLARLIAKRIRDWLNTGERLAASGKLITPVDIMVLVPRRNVFFAQLVRALKIENIPVAGVDRMLITEQLAVQDLLALLNFLLLPEDDLNLAALLKTPLFGMSEEDLFTLCHGRTGTVWSALADRQDEPAFKDIYAYLVQRRTQVDILRPYELLQEILNEPCPADPTGSARRAIWQRLGSDALDPIDELVNEALTFEAEHLPTLQHFMAWLTEFETDKKRDLSQATNQVRIMTAHASKGMEAPIVFVVDLPSGQSRRSSLLEGAEGEPPLFVPFADWADAVAEKRHAAEVQAREEENRRLLYVALTRAEDRLYVCGAYGRKMPDNAWYHAILPAMQKLGQEAAPSEAEAALGLTQIWRYETAQEHPVAAQPPPEQVAVKLELPDWARTPIEQPTAMSRPLAPSRITEPEVAVSSPGGPEALARFERGNMTHALLQHLPNWPQAERREAAAKYLQRNVPDASDELRDSVTNEVMKILEHPDYAALFGPGSQAEVPLVGIVGSHPISSRVDRLLVTKEMVQLVDYKTNRPPPQKMENMPKAYATQMAVYAALLRQIYPTRQLKIGLLWTDGPRLVDLPLDFLSGFLPEGVSLV